MSKIQVDPDTGIVYRFAGYSKEKRIVFWARCSDCGPQPPAVKTLAHRDDELVLITFNAWPAQRPLMGQCSVCNASPVTIREAVAPLNNTRPHEKCNRRCLDGKTVCHCRCQGRCHGEGKCYCDA